MTDVSISHPAKRRRGRPRKDANLSRQVSLHSPPQDPTLVNNNTQRTRLIHPTITAALSSNARQANTNPKHDGMVGSTISGVIEGSFDAGYLISVRIANNDVPFRGVIFKPKKIIPVNATNDIAPPARMCQRHEITFPFSDSVSPISTGFSPQQPQQVFRPVSPFTVSPFFGNQSAFMLSNMGANQQPPPVHSIDEVVQAFEVSTTSKGVKQKSHIHGKFIESACGPGSFTHQDIRREEMIRPEMEHPRQFVRELQHIRPQDMKHDLRPCDMYYDEMRGPDVSFLHDLFTNRSQPDPTRLRPEFHQIDLVDSVSRDPDLNLDLSSSVHKISSDNLHLQTNYLIPNEMKSLNTEFTRPGTNNEDVSSPCGPYKLELATPQSTVNTRLCEQTDSTGNVAEHTGNQGDFSETNHR